MIQDFNAFVVYNAFGGTNGNAATFARPPSSGGAIQTQFPGTIAAEIMNDAEWLLAMG